MVVVVTAIGWVPEQGDLAGGVARCYEVLRGVCFEQCKARTRELQVVFFFTGSDRA